MLYNRITHSNFCIGREDKWSCLYIISVPFWIAFPSDMLLAALCNELHNFSHTAAVWLFSQLIHLAPVWVINGRDMEVIRLCYSCRSNFSPLETTKLKKAISDNIMIITEVPAPDISWNETYALLGMWWFVPRCAMNDLVVPDLGGGSRLCVLTDLEASIL